MIGLCPSYALYGEIGNMESRGLVETEHGPRCGRGSFFNIAQDVKARSANVRFARKQQTGDIFWVAVEVDNDRFVGRKEARKCVLG